MWLPVMPMTPIKVLLICLVLSILVLLCIALYFPLAIRIKSVHISNHVFVFFTTNKDIIFYGVRSANFWTLTCNNGHIDIQDQDDHELWLR